MSLNGYSLRCGKRSGGIREIAIASVGSINNVVFSSGSTATEILTAEGAGFARYFFREDEAEYTETLSFKNNTAVIEHTLSLAIERMDDNSRRAVEELQHLNTEGFVAVLTTANNIRYLVGISEKFGIERSLRIKSATATSGKELSDGSGETVSFVCSDTSKASIFTGEIPYAV